MPGGGMMLIALNHDGAGKLSSLVLAISRANVEALKEGRPIHKRPGDECYPLNFALTIFYCEDAEDAARMLREAGAMPADAKIERTIAAIADPHERHGKIGGD